VSRPTSSHAPVTRWLSEWRHGSAGAENELLEALYPELTKLARRFLADEHAAHTLEPGALVHELWLRLTAGDIVTFEDRSHFFALAARTMRRILIDHARARLADKRGGGRERVSLSAVDGWSPVGSHEDLINLNRALSELETAAPRAARVVELRFFGGLRGSEIGAVLGISEISVKRDSRVGLAWLRSRLGDPRKT